MAERKIPASKLTLAPRRKGVIGYDERCLDLARYFLTDSDVPHWNEQHADMLAETIQGAIEYWLDEWEERATGSRA